MRLIDRILTSKQFGHGLSKILLDGAGKIIADNVYDYVLGASDLPSFTEMPCTKPPFFDTWVEWHGLKIRYAVFLVGMSNMPAEKWGEIVLNPFISPLLERGLDTYLGWSLIADQGDRGPVKVTNFGLGFDKKSGRFVDSTWPDDMPSGVQGIMAGCLSVVLQTFAFMHCKNVTVENEVVPPKLLKARTWRLGIPPVRFKTLRIVPIEQYRRGMTRKSGQATALHITRGHFKDYRSNGLFGKVKGIFWWDQHYSGTADRFVENQYEVGLEEPK